MMKVFIFEGVSDLTDNYHSGGGLVVIANDVEHAKVVIAEYKEYNDENHISISESEWKNVIVHELVGEVEPKAYVFPDAGCC